MRHRFHNEDNNSEQKMRIVFLHFSKFFPLKFGKCATQSELILLFSGFCSLKSVFSICKLVNSNKLNHLQIFSTNNE